MKTAKLSQTEYGIYLSCLEPTTAYNIPLFFEFDKNEIDLAKFKSAINTIFECHPTLNSRIIEDKDGTIKKYISNEPIEIEVFKNEVPNDKTVLVEKFNLIESPLYRIKIFEGSKKISVFIDFHHIIFDGMSVHIFLKELNEAYCGNRIEQEKFDAIDFALEEEKYRNSEKIKENEKFYQNYIGSVEVESTPYEDKKDSKIAYENFKYDVLSFDDSLIKEFVKKHQFRRSSFFNSAFGITLSKILNTNESLFLTVHNGRNDLIKNTMGMYVKTYPMYSSFNTEESCLDFIRKNEKTMQNSIKNYAFSYLDIVEKLKINADVLFAYQGDYFYSFEFLGKKKNAEFIKTKDGKEKISFELHKIDNKYQIWAEYRSDLFEKDTIVHLIQFFERCCLGLMNCEKVHEINLTDENELKLLDSYLENEADNLDLDKSVIDFYYENLDKNLDKIGLVCNEKKFTYRAIEEISNNLAFYLIEHGYKAEDVCSILINRNEYIMLATLGVVKSGMAYQPLDSTYPEDRLNFMVKDANAKVLITERSLEHLIHDFKGLVIYVDEIRKLSAKEQKLPKIHGNDLFIMLYTSGSTGVPKGVQLEHHNISSWCQWHRRKFKLNSDIRVSSYASYGFDANMMDLYSALCNCGTLYIIDEEMRLDLRKVNNYFEENKITNAMLTTQVGRQFATSEENHSLNTLLVGGEKLVPCEPPKNYELHNGYGPTECTIIITDFVVDKLYNRVPIGKGLDIVHLYVLDSEMRRVPYGVVGELYAAGPQVARGYLNREEENKKAFLKNPFDDRPYFDRLYKTGDMVKFLKDGTVDFVGRKDGLVKIRGFRIELSEVEQIVRQFKGVKDATVVSFNSPQGGNYLAAYVVSDEKIDIKKLKEFIGEEKPRYMIPEVIMQIDKIPLNQNSKVNKKALPEPKREAIELIAPKNETEKIILESLKSILGYEEISTDTDFYDAGLTSIGSIKFIQILSEKLNKDIEIKDINENPTTIKLALSISSKNEESEFEVLEDYPISKTQQGIFAECIAHKGSTNYNIPILYKLDSEVSLDKLSNAIKEAINAHYYLKTTLKLDKNGEIRAKRNDEAEVKIEHIKLENLPEPFELEPYDLMNNDLYQVKIFETKNGNYLFLDTHHIVSDGTSLAILINDINRAYKGEKLEKEKFSGYEFALEEVKKSTKEELEKQKNYYKQLLEGNDCSQMLKKDYFVDKNPDLRVYDLEIDNLLKKVNDFIKEKNFTPNAFYTSVFALMVAKLNGEEESLFTTIYNGRNSSKLLNSTVMLVKTLPVYAKFEGNTKVDSFIKSIMDELVSNEENVLYSFADIAKDFGVTSDIIFAYQGDGFIPNIIGDKPAQYIPLVSNVAKSKLGLDVVCKDNVIKLHFEYQADIFENETIKKLGEIYKQTIKEILNKKEIKEISLVDEKMLSELDEFNKTEAPIPYKNFAEVFKLSASKNKDKKAVIAIDETLTYGELYKNSAVLAGFLRKKGVKKDDKIVCMMPRIAKAYVAFQGVMLSGGAFVPVDPVYPDERINYIIEDSKSKFLVTTKKLYEEKKDALIGVERIILEDILANEPFEDIEPNIGSDALCYCIYTSGSTGKPKGVMIEHHNLVNYVIDAPSNVIYHEFTDYCSCTLALASLSFDLSIQEQMVPLASGLTILLASEDEILNPLLLSKRMIANGCDYVTTTPSYINNVLDIKDVVKALQNLKVMDLGAEAVPASLIKKLREYDINCRIYNGYGPTETTVSSTVDVVTSDRITIGYPLNNEKTYIIDKYDNILPFGATGELLICGEGVGRGYIGREDLNKEKFINFRGLKAYKTGDLARINNDGKIEFFGRKDNQVKLRGLRVEIDEIQYQINKFPGINISVVVVKETPKDGQFLAAYYVSNTEINVDELKKFIGKSLTPYMIPKVFMRLDKIPMTTNGKVDKKSLPEPKIEVSNKKIVEPKNETEVKILEIFKKALGLDEIGVLDDFFELGGTSLSASKVAMMAIEEDLPISYSDIFDNPTVRELAISIASQGKNAAEVAQNEEIIEDLPLSFNRNSYVEDVNDSFNYHNVLLTGGTGFLGIHILKELLVSTDKHIYALVRPGKQNAANVRLKGLLMYYFDDTFDEIFDDRISIIESDVTDQNLYELVKGLKIDLIINCAAIVKHFASDDSIERVNLGGVKNLIDVALKLNSRLLQVSTLSVAGENINNKFPREKRIHEYELYFGQDLSNKYVNSKFKAEEAVLNAIKDRNLDGMIVRVGNLMGRISDGEFQANAVTNNFMNSLKAYKYLGCFPVSAADSTVDISPIDEVSKSILEFAKTDKKFTIFHSANSHEVQMGDLVQCMNEYGFKIDIVKDEIFNQKLMEFMADENKNMLVSSLISYSSSDKTRISEFILSNNEFSIKALYRLGFKWSIVNEEYISKMIKALDTLGFFGE